MTSFIIEISYLYSYTLLRKCTLTISSYYIILHCSYNSDNAEAVQHITTYHIYIKCGKEVNKPGGTNLYHSVDGKLIFRPSIM